jgi:hypothetical protein
MLNTLIQTVIHLSGDASYVQEQEKSKKEYLKGTVGKSLKLGRHNSRRVKAGRLVPNLERQSTRKK